MLELCTPFGPRAAETIGRSLREAVARRGAATLALAGGGTPRAVYAALPVDLPWERVTVLFGDERCVPADAPDSNYRMAHQSLLSRIQPARVLRIEGELGPERAAARYEAALEELLGPEPALDLCLLGVGGDGHTASLFPGTPALEDSERLVLPGRAPDPPVDRVTLGLRAINSAREVIFLVTGAAKAGVLAEVLRGEAHPASRVKPAGRLRFLCDEAAAGGC